MTVAVRVAVCHCRRSFACCPVVNVAGAAAEGCCCFWRQAPEWTLHLFALVVELGLGVVVVSVVEAEHVTVGFVFKYMWKNSNQLIGVKNLFVRAVN